MTTAAAALPDPLAEQLLAAAGRRFVAVGVTKTTMAEIAAAAGVSKPTLYKRFPDKAAVVEALVQRETAAFIAKQRSRAAQEQDATAALVEAFVGAVGWLERHPFLRKSLELEPALMLPYLTTRRGPVLAAGHRHFRELVDAAVRAGAIAPVDPATAAEVWWRLVLSYVLTPEAGARRHSPASLRRLAHDVLLGAAR